MIRRRFAAETLPQKFENHETRKSTGLIVHDRKRSTWLAWHCMTACKSFYHSVTGMPETLTDMRDDKHENDPAMANSLVGQSGQQDERQTARVMQLD